MDNLAELNTISLQPYIGPPANVEQCNYALLCFCDESGKAYAAAGYLRTTWATGSTTNLIFCKTRLAPTKKVTIPRLELMATALGIRCLRFVCARLHLPLPNPRLCGQTPSVFMGGYAHHSRRLQFSWSTVCVQSEPIRLPSAKWHHRIIPRIYHHVVSAQPFSQLRRFGFQDLPGSPSLPLSDQRGTSPVSHFKMCLLYQPNRP